MYMNMIISVPAIQVIIKYNVITVQLLVEIINTSHGDSYVFLGCFCQYSWC